MDLSSEITKVMLNFGIIDSMVTGTSETDVDLGNGTTVPSLQKMTANIVKLLAQSLTANSTSSVMSSVGLKVFSIPSTKSFQPTQWVTATSGATIMLGQVVSLVNGTLTVDITHSNEIVIAENWIIVLSSPPAFMLTSLMRAEVAAMIGGNGSPDTTSPVVTLSSTSTNVTAAGSITLTADATDNIGIAKVEFYRAGVLISTDSGSPYQTTVEFTNADNGVIAFTAKAFDAADNNIISTALSVTVNITVAPVTSVTIDATTSTAISDAIAGAAKPNKRIAGANALVTALSPDHRLIISQNNVAIITVEYTGAAVAVSDGTGVYVTPSLTMDSATVSQNADLAVGTWKFELLGGSGYASTITGSVGATGSGAALELSNNPEVGAGFVDAFKLMFAPSIDV